MPYQPGKAREITATTVIEFEGEPVEIIYRKRLVQSVSLNLTEGTEIEQARNFRQAIEDLVVTWDVLDDDGKRLPATKDVTRNFDYAFLLAVFKGIVEHASPGEDGGATSKTGS